MYRDSHKMESQRAQDFSTFLQSVESFTDGQVKVSDWDADCMSWMSFNITPNRGPYKYAKINFKVNLPKEFPKVGPSVECLTNIYHPNIDPTADGGNVCLGLLEEWQSSYGLEDCVQGLLLLMKEPNLQEASLFTYFCEMDYDVDWNTFYRNARLSLTGRNIQGFTGERLIEDDSEIKKFLKEIEDEKDVDRIAEVFGFGYLVYRTFKSAVNSTFQLPVKISQYILNKVSQRY